MNTTQAIERLKYLLEVLPPKLESIEEVDFKRKKNADSWSKQEILGHLIDSATNNHHRFVRMQYGDLSLVDYHTDEWVRVQNYNSLEKSHVIQFWKLYNFHLLNIITRVPENKMAIAVQSDKIYTLEFYICDYVKHLEHHLKHIIDY